MSRIRRFQLRRLEQLGKKINEGIYNYQHNVIIFWGELSKGKTSLMLWCLYNLVQDWPTVLSFILEPHKCLKCGAEYNAHQPYKFEVMCAECGKTARSLSSVGEAIRLAKANWWVDPFPFELRTGRVKVFPSNQQFTVCEGKARGKIVQQNPYLNFSFNELRHTYEEAVKTRIRLSATGWDDVSVYFHRSNIQYMHPEVKSFFSRYSFIKTYVANLFMTVPTIDFVPEQLSLFCTADVLLSARGKGDFDVKRSVRSFYGRQKSWQKSYDGRNVTWEKVPDPWFAAYEEIRHAHAIEVFEHPEEVLVTTMPQTKEFGEEESLLD